MRRYFGTDGIRGRFGQEPMTPGFVHRIGRAAGRFFAGNGREASSGRILIGRDTRDSGAALEEALCAGLSREGLEPVRLGVLPSGAVSMLTLREGACAGAMISASHNPWEDNGLKFFQHSGQKLSDAEEEEIESLLGQVPEEALAITEAPLTFHPQPEALEAYADCLRRTLPDDFSLAGFSLVVDAAHGAAWQTAPVILRRLGAEVKSLADAPNGRNINEGCGSQHPKRAADYLRQQAGAGQRCLLGICHDGDADRVVFIDEEGTVLDGDELLAILGLGLKRAGALRSDTVVATVMSNLGLDECLREAGLKTLRTAVGDRYVLEAMREGGHSLGGEQSGHILLLDYAPTGDGLLTVLHLLRVLRDSGKTLAALRREMRKYPQKLSSLTVRAKPPLESIPGLPDALDQAHHALGSQGRLLLRYSGTENKIRLLIEAREESMLEAAGAPIMEILRREIGA